VPWRTSKAGASDLGWLIVAPLSYLATKAALISNGSEDAPPERARLRASDTALGHRAL
jgi:hypothetical protein